MKVLMLTILVSVTLVVIASCITMHMKSDTKSSGSMYIVFIGSLILWLTVMIKTIINNW